MNTGVSIDYICINLFNLNRMLISSAFSTGHHSIKQGLSNFSRISPNHKPLQPKVSCVTVFDSDSDDQLSPSKNLAGCRTKVIKPEPQKDIGR